VRAEDAVEHLGKRGICAFADNGHNGVFAALGVGEVGGAVRIGLAHYTNVVEADQLVRCIAELG
jgi:cysteine desulfurase